MTATPHAGMRCIRAPPRIARTVPLAGTKVCATCLTAKSKARCVPKRNDERNADAEWIKRIVRFLGGIIQWSRQAGCLVNCYKVNLVSVLNTSKSGRESKLKQDAAKLSTENFSLVLTQCGVGWVSRNIETN